MIAKAHSLTQRNLTYHYNSADPKNGGMDCSGTIYFLLKDMGINDVPRDSYGMYQWALTKGKFHKVHGNSFASADFSALKPGDLLFWSGTYFVKRNPPISHVMIYLGKNKQNEPLMFGASDGRTYLNKKMWGVSVFDFKLPNENSKSKFVGYSCIPSLSCS
jgi:cell wall-associated NlpC family hydrolase